MKKTTACTPGTSAETGHTSHYSGRPWTKHPTACDSSNNLQQQRPDPAAPIAVQATDTALYTCIISNNPQWPCPDPAVKHAAIRSTGNTHYTNNSANAHSTAVPRASHLGEQFQTSSTHHPVSKPYQSRQCIKLAAAS